MKILIVVAFCFAATQAFDLKGVLGGLTNGFVDQLTNLEHQITDSLHNTQIGQTVDHLLHGQVGLSDLLHLGSAIGKRSDAKQNVIDYVHGKFQAMKDVVKHYSSDLEGFYEKASHLDLVKDSFPEFVKQIEHSQVLHNALLTKLEGEIQDVLSSLPHHQTRSASEFFGGLGKQLASLGGGIQSTFQTLGHNLMSGAKDTVAKLTPGLNDLMNHALSVLQQGAGSLASNVLGAFSGLGSTGTGTATGTGA